MNTELRKNAKKKLKRFFQVDAVFGKTMDDVRNHKDIKLIINKARRNYLVSEPSYHTIKKEK